jgi:hypothetical protein
MRVGIPNTVGECMDKWGWEGCLRVHQKRRPMRNNGWRKCASKWGNSGDKMGGDMDATDKGK